MDIIVSNKITIKDYDNYAVAFCKNNLEFDNPDFEKKQQMGKWCGNTPRRIIMYEKIGNDLVLPFGCFARLWNDLKFNKDIKFISQIHTPKTKVFYNSSIKPYQYQELAINEAIRSKNGIIVMPCGSGKTQTALEIVARLGLKTLWLTHTADLLNQSMNRAKACFGLPLSEYGTITGGVSNVGNAITFATVQTMCNVDLSQLKDYFDVIIVDECHKCVGTPTNIMMFYKVLSSLSARYKFGLTATPKRADGLQKCMFAILGDIITEIPRSVVACNTCPVVVQKIKTSYTPNTNVILASDGTLVYSSLITDIIKNEERNKVIAQELLNKVNNRTLVLSDRVEHLSILNNLVCGKIKSSILKATDKKNRKTQIQDLIDGNVNCLFATYALAKEGLDIPNLDFVVFATPQKDETTVTQSAGRVGRKAQGKDFGVVVDFVDDFGMLIGYSKKRDRYYKKLDYKIL